MVQMARTRGQGPPRRAWRPASPSLGPPLLRVFGDRFSSRPRPVLGPHAQDDVALAWEPVQGIPGHLLAPPLLVSRPRASCSWHGGVRAVVSSHCFSTGFRGGPNRKCNFKNQIYFSGLERFKVFSNNVLLQTPRNRIKQKNALLEIQNILR